MRTSFVMVFSAYAVVAACTGPVAADLPTDAPRETRDEAKACDRGDHFACTNVAAAWLDGTLGATDAERALALLGPACTGGADLACVNAAALLDSAEARAILEPACHRSAAACLELGRLLAESDPVASNAALEQACDGRVFIACVEHATGLVQGSGASNGERDTAMHMLRTTCSDGSPDACREYGRLLRDPATPTPDFEMGLTMLRRACAGGDAEGCSMVAEALASSDDPAQRAEEQAFRDQACDLGWADACSR